MPKPLVECIPNFSDARRPEVIDQIVAAIQSVKGVSLLDRHSDLDHNRTVITIVGDPTAVEESVYLGIKKAAELINLDEHTGAHPRIGSTDVVPFVPISDISMSECVEMARRLGKRVADTLSIPVYLYEEAATRPDRQNLENIRKGQYEGLKTEIRTDADRTPDFGPRQLGTAGAVVIGARAPLIAFNIYLNSTDLAIAQKIAKAMRNSSGGFRFVKAMGVMVDGRAQVSMNMTNFRQTPVARIVEAVRREAERYGVGIHHSELVGLIPQDALIDAAVWYTQLEDFKSEQILENRLFEVVKTNEGGKPGLDFLDKLASADPTPGGGSASAYTGAQAAALVGMVGRVTLGKKKYVDVETQMLAMISKADDLREKLFTAVEEDASSFERFIAASRLPKETAEQQQERSAEMNEAIKGAARVPYKVMELCIGVLEEAVTAASFGNLNAISDAISAAHLSVAAIKGAAANVKINVKSLYNPEELKGLVEGTDQMIQKAKTMEDKAVKVLAERAGIE